jgi:hypothetical protein
VGTSKNILLLVIAQEKIAVSTAIFSLRIGNHKLKVFRASLMGNLLAQIASAGFSAANCQRQLAVPVIASRQLQGLFLSCRWLPLACQNGIPVL